MRRAAAVCVAVIIALGAIGAGASTGAAVERNDNIKQAVHIQTHDRPFVVTNVDASGATQEPREFGICQTSYRSLWYKLTVKETTRYVISTAGSNYDTVLQLYSGPRNQVSQDNLKTIDCNDDKHPTLQSELTRTLEPGTYYIDVGQYGYPGDGNPDGGQLLDLSVSKAP